MKVKIDIYKLAEKFHLSQSEELVFEYIINHLEESLEMGVRGVADKCYCSTSVVMNLAKKMAYKGFVDMVYRLEFMVEKANHQWQQKKAMIVCDEKLEAFQNYALAEERHIFLAGVGFSAWISNYMKDKLLTLGHYAMTTLYKESIKDKYRFKGCLILVSRSGETNDLFVLAKIAKVEKIPVILFTGSKNSRLEKLADLCFHVHDSSPMDDRNLGRNDFFGNTILFFENLLELCREREEKK